MWRRSTQRQLPPALLQTIFEALAWSSYKPFRCAELDPSALLDIPTWSDEPGSIEAWIERKRGCYRRAIPWINETRSQLLKAANLKISELEEGPSRGKLLIYEPLETVDDGAAEASSMGFYDVHDAPPWDTWVFYGDNAIFCCVPEFAISRAQSGIDANPVDCIRWADWSRLAEIHDPLGPQQR